jgi:hypothetical protein
MRPMPRKYTARPFIVAALAILGTTGCLKQLILDGQISSTRKASAAVNTLQDYEVAEKAAMAGLAQIEGMRYLAPDNEDALFMLTRSWASVSLGFIEDQMERTEDEEGTSANWDYHKRRAEAGYDRAVWYGLQLLEKKAPDFKAATKNADTMKEYLKAFEDPEDGELLFWVGNAWMSRANAGREKTELIGEIYVGVAMIERSVELDPNYMHGTGFAILGSYHARTRMAELDEAKGHFEKSLSLAGDKVLMPKVQMATRYYCNMGDKAGYEKLLNEVLAAGDGDPYQRLANVIAKRKASRWLGEKRQRENCGF